MTEETAQQRAQKALVLSVVSLVGFVFFAAALLVITTSSSSAVGLVLLWGSCLAGLVVLVLWVRRNLLRARDTR